MKMSKINILWLVIILLIVLNVTTVITVLYNNNKQKDEQEAIITERNAPKINGRYFRNLGFNAEQMKVFRTNNRTFRSCSNIIIDSINTLKSAMFHELQSANPDTVKINRISEQIGHLHKGLKQATARFYINLYNTCCNAEQKEQMKEVFAPLFYTEHKWNKRKHTCK